jgi:hypothetical protein
MKIIGIVPHRFERQIILQATADEVRQILGKSFGELPDDDMDPGVTINVKAIFDRNDEVFWAVEKLKDVPTTLRALADILTRETKVLNMPVDEPATEQKAE